MLFKKNVMDRKIITTKHSFNFRFQKTAFKSDLQAN